LLGIEAPTTTSDREDEKVNLAAYNAYDTNRLCDKSEIIMGMYLQSIKS
jgi:hypothetical protein